MSSWFVTTPNRPPQAPTDRVRLFAFPYAGRGASAFFPWRKAVPGWIEVIAAQLPGRESRLREPALTRIDAIVARLAAEIRPFLDGPYVLFGHSMGALVSYELARALRREGARAPLALMLSGRRAPTLPDTEPPMHGLHDTGFVEAMRARWDGIPQAVLENADLMALLLPTLRRDMEAIETYVHRSEPPLSLPLCLYGGEDDRRASRDGLGAWSHLSDGPTTLRMFPGGHFYLQAQQDELIEAVAQDVSGLLAATAPGTGAPPRATGWPAAGTRG